MGTITSQGEDHFIPRAWDGFTLTELLVVLAVIGVVASLALPSLSRARERAKRTACLNNLKQLTAVSLIYADEDPKGRLSPHEYRLWPIFSHNWLWRYGHLPVKSFICPSTSNRIREPAKLNPDGTLYYDDLSSTAPYRWSTWGNSYNCIPFFADMENYWNGNQNFSQSSRGIKKTTSNVQSYPHEHEALGLKGTACSASKVWLYSDADLYQYPKSFYPDPENNHGQSGMNVGFADGHTEWIARDKVVLSHETSQDNNRTRAYPRF